MSKTKTSLKRVFAISALIAAIAVVAGNWSSGRAVASAGQQAAPAATPVRFTAVAADLAGGNRPLARTVQIEIKRWSSDAEHDRLLTILREQGQEAMLDALQDLPSVGTIRTPDSLAYDLRFARSQAWGDGGQQVLVTTDRPIAFWEAANRARSMDYPFTVIQLRVQANGKGEGRMMVATKMIAAGDEIVLEHYESQPVLLTSVTRE